MTDRLERAATLRVDDLAAATSRAVLDALADHKPLDGFMLNPRIWLGIWVDLPQIPIATGVRGGPGGVGPGPVSG